MASFPTSETVSPQWLTAVLNDNQINATVTDFTAQAIGTGQIGKCIRYTLTYADGDTGPASVIGKFPSDDPDSRATGVMLQNFLKEVNFYKQLQGKLSIRTPRCFFADIVGEGPDFVILMEDLAPAQQGDQLLGCDADVARAAVLELVGLHAPSWCDEPLKQEVWLHNADAAGTDVMRTMYNAQLPGFLERYGPALSADEQAIIARVGEAHSSPLYDSLQEVFALVHVDYRLDNLMIDTSDQDVKVTVVDWQSITLGAPLNDVAYFLGAGMLPAQRLQEEEAIVRAYHEELLRAGVEDFDWPTCWNAYRRGTFAGFGVTVVASMLVQRTERGDRMFTTMAQRHARHAIDLGAGEFLV
ncbi:MAG: ecdysteroid 22-kinase family protein [Pseudomonadaceae bacterium]|nr:ecdysteroid 22-kinase family protein [Pseudomonadaceae bacterium]